MDLRDEGDGGGWVLCEDGSRRWGLYGAAGLLLRAAGDHEPYVLLQHRAAWTAAGDTWALPGGAIDSHESAEAAACRETEEEAGINPAEVQLRGGWVTSRTRGLPRPRRTNKGRAHSPGLPAGMDECTAVEWTYTTVHADCSHRLDTVANGESQELRWVPQSEVADMPLMPAFAAAWPGLLAPPAHLLLDVANIVGARGATPAPHLPWWRDRAAATADLLAHIGAAVPRTVLVSPTRAVWVARPVAIVEGDAHCAECPHTLERAEAPGSGDDEIAARAAALDPADPLVVVTSDRGLRSRLPAHAEVLGAGEFLRALGLA